MRVDPDFRSYFETAVAYRMTERFGIDTEEARRQVRDFAHYGNNSKHSDCVLAAGYDLLQPVIKASMPFVRALLQSVVIEVQSQIDRGAAAEKNLSPE